MLNKKEAKKRGESDDPTMTGEWSSFHKTVWKDVLLQQLDSNKSLDILDIGISSGLFACILSDKGHRVTSIDHSTSMIDNDKENIQQLATTPRLLTKDVTKLDLPDESFDVIISRNNTWSFEDTKWMYSEMKRILRPGGKLLIYDANWHKHYFDESVENFEASSLVNVDRPKWDETVLNRLGFDVAIRKDIGQFVYTGEEQELYGASPLFEICAVKSSMSKEKEDIHDYWQKRSSTFGFLLKEESIQPWSEPIKRHLPKGQLKVLDVGTGTGSIAAITAMLGHDVTGIDLCSNMIEEAKQNAQESELDISFMCTDAGELPFEDNTFDVVISRNVVWALMNPEEVLLQWKRVLKPGGTLFYFDGNHYYYLFDEEDKKAREAYAAITGTAYVNHPEEVDYSEMEQAALKLPLSKFDRPYEWDNKVLPKLGFQIEAIETERPQDLLKDGIAEGFYTSFHVVAKKKG